MLNSLFKKWKQYLQFVLWYFKHNKEITGELYNHFLDDEKNHSFRLIAYYNAGYSLAFSSPITKEEEKHLRSFDNFNNESTTIWSFINSKSDFSTAFIQKMKINGFHVSAHESNGTNFYHIEFKKGTSQ